LGKFNWDNLPEALKRLIRRIPDSAGSFVPEYVGLQVAGTGATRMEALAGCQAGCIRAVGRGQDCGVYRCKPDRQAGESAGCAPRSTQRLQFWLRQLDGGED
jgi:hypothetical protein